MRVDQLTLRDFTVFEPADFKFSPGLNVLIGANGTGKSHVLKVLFSILRSLSSTADVVPRANDSTSDSDSVWRKLFTVFRAEPTLTPNAASMPDSGRSAYQSLASHGANHFNIEVRGDFGGVVLDCQIVDRPYAHIDFAKFKPPSGHAVFVPACEVLSMYPGFVASYERRELSFDGTVRDLCVDLSASPLRFVSPPILSDIVAELDKAVGGKTVLRGDRFYVLISEDWLLEAAMLAEGLRKLGAVSQLIRNGSLCEGCVLFWDEPEANLNPKLITVLSETLLKLAGAGIQVFIATHDYLLTSELSLAAEYQTAEGKAAKTQFFCLSRDDSRSPVHVTSGATLAEIPADPILEEFAAHYDRERELFYSQPPVTAAEVEK